MKKRVFEIRLGEITFTPTTYEIDTKTGEELMPKRTVIGQLSYDCTFLPEELRQQLVDIIRETMLENARPA